MGLLFSQPIDGRYRAAYDEDMSVSELKTFEERAAWLLRLTGLTQKQLAQQMGVSDQFLSSLMLGKRKPNVKHLRVLAPLLNTSVSFLALETDNPAAPDEDEPDSGHGISEEAQRIANLVDLLPAWRRRYVRVIVADNRAVEVHFL